MTQETDLAYVFAALLAMSSVLLLFLPLLRHVSLFAVNRIISILILLGMLILAVGAIVLVVLAVSNPIYSAPIAGIAGALRIGSPPLLYRKFRDRFEERRVWGGLRGLLLLAFLALAGFLVLPLVAGPPARPTNRPFLVCGPITTAVGCPALVPDVARCAS